MTPIRPRPAERAPSPALRTASSATRAPRWAGAAAALLVAALSLAPLVSASRFELVWDDPYLLEQLEALESSRGLRAVLTSEFRVLADRPSGYYRPVATWSLVQDARSAWGEATPEQVRRAAARLHRTNLAIHAACSALVLLLLQQLLGFGWAAALGAAVFAVHPTHVEPAVFVSARTDSLACLFTLLSTLAWLAARARPERTSLRRWLLAAGSVAALLAVLAKEVALLLPLALAAWSLLPLSAGRSTSRGWIRANAGWLVGWLGALAVALVLRLGVAHVGFGSATGASGPGGIGDFLRLGVPAFLLYLKLWIVPWPLNSYYTASQLAVTPATWVALAVLAAMTYVAARRGQGPQAAAGWAFAAVFLLPVLHLAPLQGAAAAERFLYVPSVGLALLLAAALAGLGSSAAAPTGRILVAAALLVDVALSATGVRAWRSNQTLFTRMVATSPDSPVAHHGLATSYAEQGLQLKAIQHYERAVELKPDYAAALNGLAAAHIQMKEYEQARAPLRQALRMHPELPDAYTNMGITYAMQDSHAVAIPYFVQAARLAPRSPRTRFNLGVALLESGDREGAQAELEVLARLDARMAQRLRDKLSNAAGVADTLR